MRREGQVLIELLIAGLFLIAVSPHIPALCDRIAGYNPDAMVRFAKENAVQIQLSESRAAFQAALDDAKRHVLELNKRAEDLQTQSRKAKERAIDEEYRWLQHVRQSITDKERAEIDQNIAMNLQQWQRTRGRTPTREERLALTKAAYPENLQDQR